MKPDIALLYTICFFLAACGSADTGNPTAGSLGDGASNVGFGPEPGFTVINDSVSGSDSAETLPKDTTIQNQVLGCVPGATQLCFCSPSKQGVQVCENDSTWGLCECVEDPRPSDTNSSKTDAVAGDTVPTAPDDGLSDPNANTQCNARTKQVYLLSRNKELLRFDPQVMQISVVGTLNCPDSSPPFSMSVDNYANAWILYQPPGLGVNLQGNIYKASTVDASCVSTSFVPGKTAGFDLFGMGFVADAAGSLQETLFVAGQKFTTMFDLLTGAPAANVNGNLGSMKTLGLSITSLATLTGGLGTPELTGTGTGELWGFFPSASPPIIGQIDKNTGEILTSHDLTSLNISQTEAWAFVAWGGDFYLFLKTATDVHSKIWKIEGGDGSPLLAMDNAGYSIVGAGVSICAPTN